MKHTIRWSRRASRAFRSLQPSTKARVLEKIRGLAEEPRPADCESLQGYPYFRVRVSDYRIVYDVNDDEIRFLIGHRRNIYEQLRRLCERWD